MFCAKCSAPISAEARFCSSCGRHLVAEAVPKRAAFGLYLAVTIAMLFGLGFLISTINHVRESSVTPAQREAERKEKAEWDKRQGGIAYATLGAKTLRDSMRNPDSFKLTAASVMQDGSVCYHYRSQNGFGGMNVGEAVLAPSGTFKTSEDVSGFAPLWNKECVNKSGLNEIESVDAGLPK